MTLFLIIFHEFRQQFEPGAFRSFRVRISGCKAFNLRQLRTILEIIIMRKQDGVLSAPGLDLRIPGPYQAKAAWPLEHSPTPHLAMHHAPYSLATPVYLQRTIDPHRSNK
jgi:hypothetical protein